MFSWGLQASLYILVCHSVIPWSRSGYYTSDERGDSKLPNDVWRMLSTQRLQRNEGLKGPWRSPLVPHCRQIDKLQSPHPNHGKNFGAERHMPCMFAVRPLPLLQLPPRLPLRLELAIKAPTGHGNMPRAKPTNFAWRSRLCTRGKGKEIALALSLIEPSCLGDRFFITLLQNRMKIR